MDIKVYALFFVKEQRMKKTDTTKKRQEKTKDLPRKSVTP
jgi:hypothetical protein